MRDYRAYIFGVDGHRFIKVKDFPNDQADDDAALSLVQQLVQGHDAELWDCARLVARLSPDGEVASPELAPAMISLAPTNGKNNPVEVSKAAEAPFPENHLLLGW